MYLHANAKLGLAGRLALVVAIEEGLSLKAAAAAFRVSPATAHRWWHRWLDGGRVPSALLDRSSRPFRSPRLLAAELQERICDCRRETGWGPRLVAGATGFAHSTVWNVLQRHGLSRRQPSLKEPSNSYEWPCPGDLLHMDGSRSARFPPARPPCHRRPLAALARLVAVRDEGRRRLRARDHRRPLPGRLRRAPRRRESRNRHRLPRARARVLRAVRHHLRTADDRQRLHLHPQPIAARAAHQPRDPTHHNQALPTTQQRQG
jgi:transposase